MTEFGEKLKYFRRNGKDPERGGTLTQERLGALIGEFLDDGGYTGATISHWERGISTPNQNERDSLLALVYGLHQGGGLKTLTEANELLASGKYLTLTVEEISQVEEAWLTEIENSQFEIKNQLKPVPSPAIRDWEEIKRYLPTSLYQTVSTAPRTEREALCIDHLRRLLRIVLTYIPRHLAISLLNEPQLPESQIKGEFLEGTLLFADISGFTDLSERLREVGGKEGAEQIMRIINDYLDIMLGILFKHNGSLIKFGGDAMLCLFADEQYGALNAIEAAWEMKQEMIRHFAEVEVFQEIFSLNMKVGNNSGELFAVTVGSEIHLEYLFTGSAVEHTARAESAAQSGEIIVSEETYIRVRDNLEATPLPNRPGYYLITDVPQELNVKSQDNWADIEGWIQDPANNVWAFVDRLNAFTPYLPVGILPHLVYDPLQVHLDGQHRQVTVLFVNFVGMSDIIETVGTEKPELVTAVINQYFQAMQEEVHYFGGVTNKVDLYDQGDKLMVIFGAPAAHENDAQRAGLAALAMQEALGQLSSPLASAFLSQRIGIHTGYVFAGNVGSNKYHRREYTVMGDTVNLAARLMASSRENEVLISQDVWNQIQHGFTAAELPAIRPKGIKEPVNVYKLTGFHSEISPHLPALQSELVGRQQELVQLMDLTDDMLYGGGKRVLAIAGEGGVGKTRLITEWKNRVDSVLAAEDTILWVEGFTRPYGHRTHGIFIETLQHMMGIKENDEPADKWRKLSKYLRQNLAAQQENWLEFLMDMQAYLGQFLGFDLSHIQGLSERVSHMEPETRQLQIRLAIRDLLTSVAQKQPIILILEDIHRADDVSLNTLRFLIDRLDDHIPLIFCLVFRPQKQSPIEQVWQEIIHLYPDCKRIELKELDSASGQRLLNNLLETDTVLDKTLATLILEETDGNPLYIEQVLQNLIEDNILEKHGDGWQLVKDIDRLTVPDTLYQIIQSRIDDLDFASPGARRVLWLASILGTIFSERALRHLFEKLGRRSVEFQRHFRELRLTAMIDRTTMETKQGTERGFFKFNHGLVQQVAYENMPVTYRRQYHQDVASWIETNHHESLAAQYDALAFHYDRGKLWPKAIHYHWLCGQRDAANFANEEALKHLERTRTLLETHQPENNLSAQVHFETGKVLVTLGEFDSAKSHLQEAYDLFDDQLPKERQLQTRVCYEIGRIFELQGEDLEAALQWQAKGMTLLPEETTAATVLLHVLGGITYFRLGQWKQMFQECSKAITQSETVDAPLEEAFAHRLMSVYWRVQGNLKEALKHCQIGLEISGQISDLMGQIKGYTNLGVIAFEMDDWTKTHHSYLQAIKLLEQVGDQYELGRAYCNLGDLYFHLGDIDQGLVYAQQGLAIAEKVNSAQEILIAQVILATLHWRQERYSQALTHLQIANQLAEKSVMFKPTVERWLAQVYLSQGEIALAKAVVQDLVAQDEDILDDEVEPVQRLQAQILAAEGSPEKGIQLLENRLLPLQEANMRYQTGLTLLVLAKIKTGMSDREQQVRQHVPAALAIFSELGAQSDYEEANQLLGA